MSNRKTYVGTAEALRRYFAEQLLRPSDTSRQQIAALTMLQNEPPTEHTLYAVQFRDLGTSRAHVLIDHVTFVGDVTFVPEEPSNVPTSA